LDDFRRYAEAGRDTAGAEPTRHDHVPPALNDVPVGKTRPVFRGNECRPDEWHPNLTAVGMTGKFQRYAPRHTRKYVLFVNQEQDGIICSDLR